MVEKVSKSLDEKYYEIDHKSGLKIYVMPKENYNSAYAIFGTDYGSIDTKFKRSDKDEWTVVRRASLIFLSISCLKVRTLMLLHAMQKQVLRLMRILRLTKRAIFSSAVIILKRHLKSCLILSLTLISQKKPLKKNRV